MRKETTRKYKQERAKENKVLRQKQKQFANYELATARKVWCY